MKIEGVLLEGDRVLGHVDTPEINLSNTRIKVDMLPLERIKESEPKVESITTGIEPFLRQILVNIDQNGVFQNLGSLREHK